MSEPRYVEATGPDVETAIKNGLVRLGVSSKDVIVEVIEESSRGLFGLGGRPARVRLTLLAPPKPAAPAKPAAAPAPAPRPERKPESAAPAPAAERTATPRAERQAESDAAPAPGRKRSRRRKPAARQEEAPRSPASITAAIDRDEFEEGDEDTSSPLAVTYTPAAPDDETARVAAETLLEVLSKMGISAQVEASYASPADENETGPLVLQVVGKDLGMLIGRRGETLAALQYITRLIVSRELQARVDLVVDVEHYKARREQRLHSLALRMAKQAAQRGRTVKLEPMPAYERRIIHLALRDRTDVYTQSVGEGENRLVTIIPVKDR